jgi:hypothetical protein
MTTMVTRTPALFYSNCDVDRSIACSCLCCTLYFQRICRTLLKSIFVLYYACFPMHDTCVHLPHCPVVSFRSVFVEQLRPQSVQQALTEQFCVLSTNVTLFIWIKAVGQTVQYTCTCRLLIRIGLSVSSDQDSKPHLRFQIYILQNYHSVRKWTFRAYVVHTYIRTYTHTYMHTYIYTYVHNTYIHYIHTYVHTYIHTLHTYAHYIHSTLHTYIHTFIHTLHTHVIHTYIHTLHTYIRT